jgi:DNA-directed RNA polymerase II subunit RPB4
MNEYTHPVLPSSSIRAPRPGDPEYQPASAKAAARQRDMIRDRSKADSEVRVDGPVLELGPEFEDSPALSISEARFVVEQVFTRRRKEGKTFAINDVMRQMQNHMDTFARFDGRDQLTALEELLQPYKNLSSFEKSQLSSLVPGDHEEAKMLIPSLTEKMKDENLDVLCQEIIAVKRV